MGVAYYLTADRPIPELLGEQLDGKALAHLDQRLEDQGLYATLGARPMSEFFGDVVDIDGLSSDFDDAIPDEHVVDEVWFEPAAGLVVVQALMAWLASNPGFDDHQDTALAELALLEQDLLRVQAAGARWHLSLDI